MINVMAIFRDFSNSSTFYSSSIGDIRIIEEIFWNRIRPTEGYFPNRLQNLNGSILPVLFGGNEPGFILSQNKNGENKILGQYGHFFEALAKKHNAKLNTSNVILTKTPFEIYQLVLNGTVEMTSAAKFRVNPVRMFTIPYEVNDWCIMLPVEPIIPIFEIYTIIFEWQTLVILIVELVLLSALLESATFLSGRKTSLFNYFFNDKCLRGLIGQSFSELPNTSLSLRLIYSLLFVLGMLMVTSYDAFLQTYRTTPPSEKILQTFDDVRESSRVKIRMLQVEMEALSLYVPDAKTRYSHFVLEKNYTLFKSLRDSLNTSWAYPATSDNWSVSKNQQNLFTRPTFRFAENMCLYHRIQNCFPINENCIYRDILNRLILQIHEAGLLDFWRKRAFHELVEIGRIKMEDLGQKREMKPMKVEDLKLIWFAFGIACGVNGFVFFDRMKNLKGSRLPILFGGAEPGLIISENSNDDIVFGGHLGHIVSSFAKKHNAKLGISNVNASISPYTLQKLVLNDKIDITGASMINPMTAIEWYSHPVAFFDWGVMVPVEPIIPINKYRRNSQEQPLLSSLILIAFVEFLDSHFLKH
ncbi:uncharacterized protein LOC129918161 [Episyrphus balteatus]|uniref:uncharacterized protein LOC129918161 n=1 Tax=Episyrphus balteatus TaxID=286459 RepID=UPI0024851FED|nr:uncharacterized protein LOC129918161 [Episyrphus balteatus]